MNTKSLLTFCVCAAVTAGATGATLFSDDFEDGASPMWGNEIGGWLDTGGVYRAGTPSNAPLTVTSLPLVVSDFRIDVDINDIQDGGIWLRAEFDQVTGETMNGVLLVTGGNLGTYSGFYWHVVQDGNYSGAQNASGAGLFVPGESDELVTVKVIGDRYMVFLGGNDVPATTLETGLFCQGLVGLYDFSDQTFDNFVLSETCEGDLDGDEIIGVTDILRLLSLWGDCECPCAADLDDDGFVGVTDLLVELSAWGPCR